MENNIKEIADKIYNIIFSEDTESIVEVEEAEIKYCVNKSRIYDYEGELLDFVEIVAQKYHTCLTVSYTPLLLKYLKYCRGVLYYDIKRMTRELCTIDN